MREAGIRGYVLKEWPCSEVTEMSHVSMKEALPYEGTVVCVLFC